MTTRAHACSVCVYSFFQRYTVCYKLIPIGKCRKVWNDCQINHCNMETYCNTAGVLSLGLQPLQPLQSLQPLQLQSPQVLWKKGICVLNVYILVVHDNKLML